MPLLRAITFDRPVLLDATLLKCALLAVALPQTFVETTEYPRRAEVDAAMANLRRRDNNKNTLQERPCWNTDAASAGFGSFHARLFAGQ